MASVQVVAGVRYFVHPQVIGTITESPKPQSYIPAIFLNHDMIRSAADSASGSIVEQFEYFKREDDVYNEGFSRSVIIRRSATLFSDLIIATLERFERDDPGLEIYKLAKSPPGGLKAGPYFLHGQNIHQAWRLYDDVLDAFIFGLVPDDVFEPKRFTPLEVLSQDGIRKSIAVPSRLYRDHSLDKPLAGSRLCLKDIFRVAGVKTTMMSRAYTDLYEPETESAEYVKRLISMGAVIVGKTKMTQFASSDEPTDQWIDFHCPINPRGDMYQSPEGSSSGAAAALAGYSWLDESIGGDSAGSIRAPATSNGLFSIRPTLDTAPMDGIVVNSPMFDVVGLFGRDLSRLYTISNETLDNLRSSASFPKRIIYPSDFFPHSDATQQAMVEEFITILERFLGTTRTEISIAERWEQRPPPEAQGKSLEEYLAKSAFWPLCHDYYHGFDDFRSKYRRTFGTEPYVGPVVRYRWGVGQSVTADDYQAYVGELKVFRDWFDQNILSKDFHNLSDAIMIMPYGSADPKYRDAPNEAPSSHHTIGAKFISPVLGMPQVVLPIGQMPYVSRVSGQVEYRPIAGTMVGAQDNDLMLLRLAELAFKKAGWPTTINTGRYMLPVGDNLRNVASP